MNTQLLISLCPCWQAVRLWLMFCCYKYSCNEFLRSVSLGSRVRTPQHLTVQLLCGRQRLLPRYCQSALLSRWRFSCPPLSHILGAVRHFKFWQSHGERVGGEAAILLQMTKPKPSRARNLPKVTQPRSSVRLQTHAGLPDPRWRPLSLGVQISWVLPLSSPGELLFIPQDFIQRPLSFPPQWSHVLLYASWVL